MPSGESSLDCAHDGDPKPAKGPLCGLRILDLGVGMAAALVAKFLQEAGAQVDRVDPPGGDPFDEVYPAYAAWRSVLNSRKADRAGLTDELVLGADICIVGGEDYPGRSTRHEPDLGITGNRRLIILDIVSALAESGADVLHGADILAQARSGLVFEAYPDRPAVLAFAPASIGAALQGLTALAAALIQRERDGRGQIVRAGLLEGAMTWPLGFVGTAENETAEFSFRAPKGARPLIFRTRDNQYVQLVLGSSGAKFKLYQALGIDDPNVLPSDAGMPSPSDGPDRYFGDVDLLAPLVADRDRDELVECLKQSGVICEKVRAPGDCWDDAQVERNDVLVPVMDEMVAVGQPVTWALSPGGPGPAPTDGVGPLAGIKVVDFGAFVAGPFLSVGLADLGADVVKIEPPTGDPLRALYKFYAGANRGKRSIAIDMKSKEGLALAHRIAGAADIVCSNFRNGVAERLGIDARSLHAKNPEKIVVTSPGYGAAGPQALDPAFDPCMQANCGLEVRGGGRGNPPSFNAMMVVDLCGGKLGLIGALFALYRRWRDGSGAAVTVPLLNAGLFLMSDIVRAGDDRVIGPTCLLPDQTGYHAAEKLYRTRDGWIAVAARGQAAARAFARACGIASVERKNARDWDDADAGLLAAAVARCTTDAAVARLRRVSVPVEPCREQGAREYLTCDRNVLAGRVYEAHRQKLGRTRGTGVLYSMSRSKASPSGELSEKGEDSRPVLTDVGLSPERAEDLIARQVVSESRAGVRQ